MKKLPQLLILALLTLGPVVLGEAQVHQKEPVREIRSMPGDSFDLGGRTVFVPVPEGFTNGLGRFERFSMVMTSTEGPDLDTLAAHVPNSLVEELAKGATTLDLYTKVSVAKKGRALDVTPEGFTELIASVEKNFNSYLDPNSPVIKRTVDSANTKLKEQTGKDVGIDLGQPTNLGFFDKQANVFSAMVMMNVTANGEHKTVLTSISYLLLNKRCIYAYGFKVLSSEKDVKTLQDFTKKWTAAIVAANK